MNANLQKKKMASGICLGLITIVLVLVLRKAFTLGHVTELPLIIDSYIDEHLPLREQIIGLQSMIDYYVFYDNAGKDTVRGKDGWFFYEQTIPGHKRINLYTDQELEHLVNNFFGIEQYLAERNIEFVVFIAPNKASVYPQAVPAYYKQSASISRAEQLAGALRAKGLRVVYPSEEMQAVAQTLDEPLYYHLDTHWNGLGAYVGTRALLNELGITVPAPEALHPAATNKPYFEKNGYDLSKMMGLQHVLNHETSYEILTDEYSDTRIQYLTLPATEEEAFVGLVQTKSDSENTRKLFMIRDSFATSMLPYLAPEFCEVYSPYKNYMSLNQIGEQNPDIVVLEFVERDNAENYAIDNWD